MSLSRIMITKATVPTLIEMKGFQEKTLVPATLKKTETISKIRRLGEVQPEILRLKSLFSRNYVGGKKKRHLFLREYGRATIKMFLGKKMT